MDIDNPTGVFTNKRFFEDWRKPVADQIIRINLGRLIFASVNNVASLFKNFDYPSVAFGRS
jgi:hypothetical protein